MTIKSTDLLEPLMVPGACQFVLDRWSAVVHSLGDQPALSSPGVSYTFGEADALSDVVAVGLLRELPDDEVAVATLVDHTADGLIALLGVMKAGRVVVVLDRHLPASRLRQISELAGTMTCLADARDAVDAQKLGAPLTKVLRLDDLTAEANLAGGDVDRRSVSPDRGSAAVDSSVRGGQDALSIVFTSGSTGRPKGVVQTHGQILNDAFAHRERFRITQDDRVALVLPYGFAAGLSLLFGALLNGAGVWSYDPREGGTRGLVAWLTEQRLSTIHCTPHLLRSLVGVLSPGDVFESLRFVATVGEAIHGRDVEAIRPHLPAGASFFNWTGSSEMGILALHEICGGSPLPAGVVPAGRPVANKEVRLLREDGTVAEDGESGEIVTTSDYLSGGYWKDDEGNAARFTVDPDGRRVCRQGDMGRFDEHGDLILLGRVDAAIKVRGYLVEPGEIEAAFLASEGVQEVVVVPIVEPPAPTRLVAYVVPRSSLRAESPAAMRRRLRVQLPEYMVPSVIVQLPELPRNERGKVERSGLPTVQAASQSAPPTNQWEIVVGDLWSEVLGLGFVGLDDDFMALGGDSLSAEEMLIIVQERFGVALVSTDLIDAPTLREFTRRVTLGSASLPSHPDVVTLQSGGTKTPLFCFAGSGALALTFLPLSRHIDDCPIYAFQAHGLEKRALPDWTVEATSRRYLQIIRIVQPRGPYTLLGHSFGGLVALEIARVLTDAGERVDFVGLLDTYLPRSAGLQPTPIFESMVDRPSAPTLLRLGRQLVNPVIHRLLPDGLPALRQWSRQGRAYLAGMVPFSGQRQFDAFFDQGIITSRRFKLRPYAGRALVVLADNNPDGPDAWKPFLTGPHEFINLRSEHTSLLREPYAAELAAILATKFAQVGP